jgi:hypothetical protein
MAQASDGLTVSVYNMFGYNNAPPTPTEDKKVYETVVPNIDFQFGSGGVFTDMTEDTVVKFEGTITSPVTGDVIFYAPADDGAKLYIDGVNVIDDWYDKGGGGSESQPISFTANVPKSITLWYYENGGGAWVELNWQLPGAEMTIVPASAFVSQSAPVAKTIGAPTNLVVTDGDTLTALTWEAPSTGNTQPERYAISFSSGNDGWGIATGNVGDANALNTTITISHSLLENLKPSGTVWSFHIRSDNDTLRVYSENSNVVTLKIGKTAEEITAAQALIAAELAARLESERQAELAEAARIEAERQAALAEAARKAAEEEAKRQAIAAEAARQAAIAAEQARQQELARQAAQAAEAERQRLAFIAAEQARIKAEEEIRLAEADRKMAEMLAKIAEDERKQAEEDARIAEELRIQAEEDARIAEENAKKAEEERIKAEEEAKIAEEKARIAEEEAKKAEEDAKRAEEERIKAEEERIKAEQERVKAEQEKIKAEAEAKAAAELKAKQEAEAKAKAEEEAKPKPIPTPKPEPVITPPPVVPTPEPTKVVQDSVQVVDDAKADGVVTEEETQAIVAAVISDAITSGDAITTETLAEAGIEYKDLPPETPVELDNGVVITAEVAVQVELLQNPSEFVSELFTDPAAAFAALGSVGADMTPEVRAKSEKVVIAAVIAGNIATTAATGAAAVAAYRRKP